MATLTVEVKAQQKLLDTLAGLRDRMSPTSPAMKTALIRASVILVSQIKLNLRAKKIVDQGRLLNSIRYEFIKTSDQDTLRVLVGSFGVPYAAMHEFGGHYPRRQMRAMFASLRDQGKLNSKGGGKGVLVNGQLRARPYIRPAFLLHKQRVMDYIKAAIEG